MPNQNPVNVASEREVRRQKLADLQAAGRDPYTITKSDQTDFAAALQEVANVEKPAKLEGRNMLMFLASKPAK